MVLPNIGFETEEDACIRSLPAPTCAKPGSAEKVAVLAERWNSGFELHHPDDNRISPPVVDIGQTILALPFPSGRSRYLSEGI